MLDFEPEFSISDMFNLEIQAEIASIRLEKA